MPPMATSSTKRKWSDVFGDKEIYDKQSIMDLCSSKLRYVNPARPPRRRTEVPLLRNVLIVNTMKHLSAEMKTEKLIDFNSEDLCVDPGHFEGLPPLSELLTDIMLDPQPADQQSPVGYFGWTSASNQTYPCISPLESNISSYMDVPDSASEIIPDKIVHDLMPCASLVDMDHNSQPCASLVDMDHNSQPWHPAQHSNPHTSTWQVTKTAGPHHHDPSPWSVSADPGVLDCFLSSISLQPSATDTVDTLTTDLSFQPSSHIPLPSFNTLFESSPNPSFTDLLHTSLSSPLCTPTNSCINGFSTFCTSSSSSVTGLSSLASVSSMTGALAEDFVSNVCLTDSELELLAMTFSSKLPMSFEDIVHALPQTPQPSQTFCVPSLQNSGSLSPTSETSSASLGQCGSFCRNDQSPPNVDDNSMVRVLVNL